MRQPSKPAKSPEKDEPSGFTMDDIARRFLSSPPVPHKPVAKPVAKKPRKSAK